MILINTHKWHLPSLPPPLLPPLFLLAFLLLIIIMEGEVNASPCEKGLWASEKSYHFVPFLQLYLLATAFSDQSSIFSDTFHFITFYWQSYRLIFSNAYLTIFYKHPVKTLNLIFFSSHRQTDRQTDICTHRSLKIKRINKSVKSKSATNNIYPILHYAPHLNHSPPTPKQKNF